MDAADSNVVEERVVESAHFKRCGACTSEGIYLFECRTCALPLCSWECLYMFGIEHATCDLFKYAHVKEFDVKLANEIVDRWFV